MTFQDIFKTSFLENAASLSYFDIALAMLIALCLGLFIFLVYRKTFAGVMYSASFGVTLIAMTLITTLIILAISSNIILSLGMVGALSIVRFRTPVKEVLDIAYIFWAISAGIVVGAGLLPLAIFGTLFIGIVLFVFVNRKSTDTPYLIVVNYGDENSEAEVLTLIKEKTKKYLVKAKTVSKNGIELTVEVRLQDTNARLVNELLAVNGVENAVLVSYNGEYM
ncbi:MAG TPA: DUF4956 domain-containing protein [Syntrophomonadaceae bacterium]|nr:DUF4956 domain-containing protein [Syntrophomonadaceae bacterium]